MDANGLLLGAAPVKGWILGVGMLVVLVVAVVVYRLISKILKKANTDKLLTDAANKKLAAQSDRIHFEPDSEHEWRNPDLVSASTDALVMLGFTEVGSFRIAEMPNVFVKFLVKEDESMGAAIFEHPKTGEWVDLFCYYEGDNSYTVTTSHDPGLDKRDGTVSVHLSDASPAALYEQLTTGRSPDGLLSITAENVTQRFEDAYAVNTAWRKSKGISAKEMSRHAVHFKARKKQAPQPVEEAPAEETPAEEAVPEEAPAEEVAAGEEAPAGDIQTGEEMPADESPAEGSAPAENVWVGEEAPAEDAVQEETPAEEVVTGEETPPEEAPDEQR